MSSTNAESAILLVGGFGTRLQPLTFNTPKPMLKVAGIPFTEHQIIKAREAGIKEIVLATSYLAQIFEPHFGNGEKFGISISYAVEEVALGTGGAIRNAAKALTGSGPVVIFNGDVLSSHDLRAHIAKHVESNADVSLYLTEVPDARAFGAVELDGDLIQTFNEKMENPPTNIINAGCYIFNREIINSIPAGRVVSVERETFPGLLAAGSKLIGYVDRSYWLDIGTPTALLKATHDLITGSAQSDAFDLLLATGEFRIVDGSLISTRASIHPSARVSTGSFIDHDVEVGMDAKIVTSVIGAGARVDARAELHRSFLAPKSQIPAGFYAEGSFFGFSSEHE
jgi:mannose-1-phosphate guanylyltransferase